MAKDVKRIPASVQKRHMPLLLGAGLLLLGSMGLQHNIDPYVKEIHKQEGGVAQVSGGLNNEFMLLPLLGFREAAAGLLWVRCDEFFHSGDYDAILPLVRVITLLDPHAENVYVTGAWHLSYNFTDASERSDRRYIAPSEALLDEGIENNPDIPDIKFEKGWQNYDKIKDFIEAEKALKSCIAGAHGDEKGVSPDADGYPYAAPLKALHLLAHTYEKQGRIPEALEEWKKARDRSEEMMAEDKKNKKPLDYSTKQLWYAEVHNYDETLQRYRDRYTTTGHDQINPSKLPGVYWPTGKNISPQPWDVAFETHIDLKRAKVFKISGRFNSADGARVDVRITDWDYKPQTVVDIKKSDGNPFAVDMSQTILVDSISVRKNKFEREMDMSKDPKMYSFSEPYYKIIISYNPRTTSPHLHDRFGWSGEGITSNDPKYVIYDTHPELAGTTFIKGQGGSDPIWDGKTIPWHQNTQPIRKIMVTYKVSRSQIMGSEPITDKDIVPNEL